MLNILSYGGSSLISSMWLKILIIKSIVEVTVPDWDVAFVTLYGIVPFSSISINCSYVSISAWDNAWPAAIPSPLNKSVNNDLMLIPLKASSIIPIKSTSVIL